jgi:Domain of unknown function (DUF4384)
MLPSHLTPRMALPISGAVLTLLTACAGTPSQSTLSDIRTNSNPTDRAQRVTTNFTPALRCMDDMMFTRGTRDVSVMMEELRDATQRVPISARDMMTSAMSDISRRSRGVRLSVFGTDQQNLLQFLQTAQKATPFAVVPQYSIRGTVSQMDETVQRTSSTFGASLAESLFGVRFASDSKFAVMGFDAAVVNTESMTLMPGVASKNTTVLVSRDASAEEGQARLVKQEVGLVFSMSSSRADGPAQAARNMVDLATIELVGKLIKAPYWQCLGISDSDAEVQREMDDWFFAMDKGERIAYFKERMRESRYYDGPIDDKDDAAFKQALQTYRRAMGLAVQGPLDQVFFRQFVTRAVPKLEAVAARQAPIATASSTPSAPPAPSTAASPMTLAVLDSGNKRQPSAELDLRMNTAGYVYCYSQDTATGRIQRIFPNRFQRDPRLAAGQSLRLPGQARFTLSKQAQYACIQAPQEVYADLPAQLKWGDFEDIRLNTFEDIRQKFAEASGLKIELIHTKTRHR